MPERRLQLICAVIDVATSEQSRPLKEFFRWPHLPIREMYLTRLIINLVYFARNYLNGILLLYAFCAFLYPLIIVVLASAGIIHLCKSKPTMQKYINPLKLLQTVLCIAVIHSIGILPVVFINALPMAFVACHAAFTPYTDEAMSRYEVVMCEKGFAAPAPRSPTTSYENVDKTFASARSAFEAHVESAHQSEAPRSARKPAPTPRIVQSHPPVDNATSAECTSTVAEGSPAEAESTPAVVGQDAARGKRELQTRKNRPRLLPGTSTADDPSDMVSPSRCDTFQPPWLFQGPSSLPLVVRREALAVM